MIKDVARSRRGAIQIKTGNANSCCKSLPTEPDPIELLWKTILSINNLSS